MAIESVKKASRFGAVLADLKKIEKQANEVKKMIREIHDDLRELSGKAA